jgi:hypothetical protein
MNIRTNISDDTGNDDLRAVGGLDGGTEIRLFKDISISFSIFFLWKRK